MLPTPPAPLPIGFLRLLQPEYARERIFPFQLSVDANSTHYEPPLNIDMVGVNRAGKESHLPIPRNRAERRAAAAQKRKRR